MASYSRSPGIWSSFANLFGGLAGNAGPSPTSKPTPDELRAERDFINEMIWNNPDAFSNELDVQNMMLMFPGRF